MHVMRVTNLYLPKNLWQSDYTSSSFMGLYRKFFYKFKKMSMQRQTWFEINFVWALPALGGLYHSSTRHDNPAP